MLQPQWRLRYLCVALQTAGFCPGGRCDRTHAGAITEGGYDLTLSTFAAGGRYAPRLGHAALRPFGQVLAGVAHSSGSLVERPNSAASNAGAAFAAHVGGGMGLLEAWACA